MNCGEFIGELFRASNICWIEHLQASHMDGHVVLQELYEALDEHKDSIAEMRLARGKVPIPIKNVPEQTDIIDYLENELLPMVDMAKERTDLKGFNDISAEIDMVKTTVMKKLYKLKNLVGEKHLKQVPGKEETADDMVSGGLLYRKKCGGKVKKLIK